MRNLLRTCRCVCLVVVLLEHSAGAAVLTGTVIDADTQAPVAGAILTTAGKVSVCGPDGRFHLDRAGETLAVRMTGYRRAEIKLDPQKRDPYQIKLKSIRVKALYLSVYGIGSSALRDAALHLIEHTELNALVIDVKGDRGLIPYNSAIPLAKEIGARSVTTVRDMPALVATLKQKEIYLIARIVVFKDNPLANARPELAVKEGGTLWHDREYLAWIDPFQAKAWAYNIDIAEEAAKLGFDEIQFDYTRFPDSRGLSFSQPNTRESRVKAIDGFLAQARERLAPYNVFLAADIFGYVCWNLDDTAIGQQLEELGKSLDYISPMLYPSGFHLGIPGYRDSVSHGGEIVLQSLNEAKRRTGLPGTRFRPWLQAFPDYAFDRRQFGAKEIREQIDAADTAGTDGWMLWNPRNHYSENGLTVVKDTQGGK